MTSLNDKLKVVVLGWYKRVGAALIDELRKAKVTFSGGSSSELVGSLEINTKRNNPLEYEILMFEYWEAVDQGRKPSGAGGKGELKNNLKRWISRKGLESFKNPDNLGPKELINTLAYLISRKIHTKGYKGKFFVDPALTQTLVDDLGNEIAEVTAEHITDIINGDNNT